MRPAAVEPFDFGPLLKEGEWAGWSIGRSLGPFGAHVGPYYVRQAADGRVECGAEPGPALSNGDGSVHRGALMAFADYTVSKVAAPYVRGRRSLTTHLSGDFISDAPAAARLTSHGRIMGPGGSVICVNGRIEADGRHVLTFAGVIRIFYEKS